MSQVIAVTGATGFIGQSICRRLIASGYAVRALVRNPRAANLPSLSDAEIIAGEASQVPGATDVRIAQRMDYPIIHLEIDRVKAALAGVNVEDIMKSGFTIFNPNAVKSCACGSSFDTADSSGKDSAKACC